MQGTFITKVNKHKFKYKLHLFSVTHQYCWYHITICKLLKNQIFSDETQAESQNIFIVIKPCLKCFRSRQMHKCHTTNMIQRRRIYAITNT